MYTLRRILENGFEYNFQLGKNYTLILKERVSEEEWKKVSENYWSENCFNTNTPEKDKHIFECYGFVRSESGEDYFLLPWQKNYIMTESGKTFYHLK